MKIPGRDLDAIESQAVAWLVRRDGGMSEREKASFDRWCAADPRHAQAVAEVDAWWTALDHPGETGRTESLRAELRALDRRDRRRRQAAFAATALAAACVAVAFWPQNPPARNPAAPIVASTARITAPERQLLPDGSVVEFKQGAEITVAFGEKTRLVVLKNGEAHFTVTKNPQKPFVVEAGDVKIRAVGTAFAVQLGRAEVEVIVTEGKVSITPPPPVARLETNASQLAPPADAEERSPPIVEIGQRAIVPLEPTATRPAVISVPLAELAERLAWRLPQLDFSETSIAEAIDLFNRQGRQQLRAGDSAVGALRVTGVFRSDNIEGFVRALQISLGIRVERQEREIVLRHPG